MFILLTKRGKKSIACCIWCSAVILLLSLVFPYFLLFPFFHSFRYTSSPPQSVSLPPLPLPCFPSIHCSPLLSSFSTLLSLPFLLLPFPGRQPVIMFPLQVTYLAIHGFSYINCLMADFFSSPSFALSFIGFNGDFFLSPKFLHIFFSFLKDPFPLIVFYYCPLHKIKSKFVLPFPAFFLCLDIKYISTIVFFSSKIVSQLSLFYSSRITLYFDIFISSHSHSCYIPLTTSYRDAN